MDAKATPGRQLSLLSPSSKSEVSMAFLQLEVTTTEGEHVCACSKHELVHFSTAQRYLKDFSNETGIKSTGEAAGGGERERITQISTLLNFKSLSRKSRMFPSIPIRVQYPFHEHLPLTFLNRSRIFTQHSEKSYEHFRQCFILPPGAENIRSV